MPLHQPHFITSDYPEGEDPEAAPKGLPSSVHRAICAFNLSERSGNVKEKVLQNAQVFDARGRNTAKKAVSLAGKRLWRLFEPRPNLSFFSGTQDSSSRIRHSLRVGALSSACSQSGKSELLSIINTSQIVLSGAVLMPSD